MKDIELQPDAWQRFERAVDVVAKARRSTERTEATESETQDEGFSQMSLQIDDDVEAAALLLQRNFPAAKLVSIACALSDLAPALWGRHGREARTRGIGSRYFTC